MNVNISKSLGGSILTYFSAYTQDGYELICDLTEGPYADGVSYCKDAIDNFIDIHKCDTADWEENR